MKIFKLSILYVFLVIIISGCGNNFDSSKSDNDLSNELTVHSESIKDLEERINKLNLEIDNLNDKMISITNLEQNYTDLKNKYDKLLSENKNLKSQVSNLNSLISDINKKNSNDIVYITFVAKGQIRISQILGNYYVYEGNVYNLPINMNYTLEEQLPYFFKNGGPRDSSCNRTCWLKDINSTECINIHNFKTDSNVILYSICLSETPENDN